MQNCLRPAAVQILTAVLLLVSPLGSHAQIQPGTAWHEAVSTDLDVDFGDTGFHARWRFQRCECGDLHVRVEQVAPDGVLHAELLMVGGQVLLARNYDGQDVDIEPLIQAPSLMLQLAHTIFNLSQPAGPYAVGAKQQWEVSEENIDFKLDTGLATGMFAAPWQVSGSGWKTDTGRIRFEVDFTFTNPLPADPQATNTMVFSGDLDFQQRDFPYTETTDMGGWKIQWLVSNDRESEAVPKGVTLKELRQHAEDL